MASLDLKLLKVEIKFVIKEIKNMMECFKQLLSRQHCCFLQQLLNSQGFSKQ